MEKERPRGVSTRLGSPIFLIVLSASALLAESRPAEASKRDHASALPVWISQSLSRPQMIEPSQSYLRHYFEIPDEGPIYENSFYDRGTTYKMQVEYRNLVRDHEMRQAHGLNLYEHKGAYRARMEKFSKYMARTVLKKKIDTSLDQAEKNSKEVRTIKVVHTQVKRATRGKLNVQVNDQIKLRTRLSIPRQYTKLALQTPLINTSFHYWFGGDGSDPTGQDVREPWDGFERYKLGASPKFSVYGVRSGFTYGGSSTRLSANLSRRLTRGLTCTVSSTWGMDEYRAGLGGESEQSVRMKYRIRF